jgi:4-hydroxybenzoate polyprenyltransferase
MSATATASPVERLRTYASFVRFEHTLFSLPLVLAGVFSQPGPALPWTRWALVLVAAAGARTAGMSLNRLIDRRLDALNPRTRGRELPSGRMRMAEALALLGAGCAAYFAAAAGLGSVCLRLSPIPLVVFATYPYLKRFTPLCHFGVGLALAMAPLAGYIAAHPGLESPGPALWLGVFALFWVSGFDIIYVTLDEESDRLHGIRSMVAWLGRERGLRVSAFLHAAAAAALVGAAATLFPWDGKASPWHAVAVGLVVALAARLLQLEQRWAEDVNLAFFKVNVVVGIVVLALVLVARVPGGF